MPTEFEAGELLSAIGMVEVPEPRVLEDAREVLWSAVTGEMLGTGPAGEQATATREPAGTEQEQHRTTQRGQADRSQNERKMSMGSRDPDS